MVACAAALGLPMDVADAAGRRAVQDTGAVHGLIVRLKQAPSHARLGERGAEDPEVRHEARRWGRVVGEAGLGAAAGRREPSLRPVGRDQQVLTFEKPLSRQEAQDLAARLAARPDVDWVDLNTRERRLQVPRDPYFTGGQQWWLRQAGGSNQSAAADRLRGVAGFQRAWLQPGGTGQPAIEQARVAVLDTGITAHPELDGRILPGYDFVTDIKFAGDGNGRDSDPSDPGDFVSAADLADAHFKGCAQADSSWHGTVIAGQLAALTDNDAGVASLNWAGRVLPVRVAGKCGADVADIIDGMRWAAGLDVTGVPRNANPVRIVNISFGGSAACSVAYQTAIDELEALGVVVVAAAGNEHVAPTRPANCRGVVGVAGLNRDGFKASYSNFGSELSANGIATVAGDDPEDADARWNALADPGIWSTLNAGSQTPVPAPSGPSYGYLSGTSFAAPQVAGTIGLMLSVNPRLTHAQILDGLRRSARPHVTSPRMAACAWSNPGRCLCTTSTCGAGILDAEQALLFAANPTTYVAPARSAEVIDTAELTAAAALGPDRDANPSAPPVPGGDGSGGGGAFSGVWLALLCGATALLRPSGPRRRRA